MFRRISSICFLLLLYTSVFAQEKFTVVKDLRTDWMTFEDGAYQPVGESPIPRLNTLYFPLDLQMHGGNFLKVQSDRPYFLFVNGKVAGEFRGGIQLKIDSLLQQAHGATHWIAIHQVRINERDLKSEIISLQPPPVSEMQVSVRPYSYFRDFVVISGLIIILLFLLAVRVNPKLAADYFSVTRLLASREADDSQASARLTSGSNVQFYILCSLMIGFYLIIIMYNLPPEYALPIRFEATGFWTMGWQWLKLSVIVLYVFFIKLLIVFSLTRLFDMHGMARHHFFNWVRLLLVVFGAATIILFIYFISRGDHPYFFVVFLSMVVAVLVAWIVMAFFKLSGRSGHSMFHLFSYLCATEIIPLLITVKILFQ
jgi:hypothetical protein